jgi:hypothetical protein
LTVALEPRGGVTGGVEGGFDVVALSSREVSWHEVERKGAGDRKER